MVGMSRKQMRADLDYWQEIEKIIPTWKVFGWSYRRGASFDTGNGQTLSLTGDQRDAIVTAFASKSQGG